MDKVKIEEIAQELGASSNKVYERAVLMSINVKSVKSSVSIDDAQRIFDAILHNQIEAPKQEISQRKKIEKEYSSFYKRGKLYISLSNQNIDLNFNKHIVDTFKNDDIDNFLLFSYSHSDDKLKSNFKEFYDDFDMGTIKDDKPLENLEYYVKRYNPNAILIDGIDYEYLVENYEKIFTTIKNIFIYKIKLNFGVVNISKTEQKKFISKVNKFLN